MSREYHKSLVDMIKKYAVAAPKPDANYVKPKPETKPATTKEGPPATTTGRPAVPGPTDTAKPAGPTSGGVANTQAFSPAVKKMQEALIALSRDVDAQLKVENVTQVADGKATQEAREAAQRASFSNFIAKHMMRQEVPATEFDPSANVTKVENKKPSEATRMTTILDTMRRIGGEANEVAPDGKWGDRTNQALKNANSFAYALLKLASDFKVEGLKSYSEGSRADFKVPETSGDWNYNQKVEYAPILTQHLVAIRKLFHEVKNSILENPEYQTYIEGNTPFVTYKKVQQLSPAEKDMIKFWTSNPSPGNDTFVNIQDPSGAGNLQAKINYADLASPDAFAKWFESDAAKQFKQPGVDRPMIMAAIRKALQARASGGA